MPSSYVGQSFEDVETHPAILAGHHEHGIRVRPGVGGRLYRLPLDQVLADGQQREWSFLLECWCLYNELEMQPAGWSAQTADTGAYDRPELKSITKEVALSPAQILAFLDWAMTAGRHEQPGNIPVTSQLSRLRAFLKDDVSPSEEVQVVVGS